MKTFSFIILMVLLLAVMVFSAGTVAAEEKSVDAKTIERLERLIKEQQQQLESMQQQLNQLKKATTDAQAEAKEAKSVAENVQTTVQPSAEKVVTSDQDRVKLAISGHVNRAVNIGRKVFGPSRLYLFTEYFYNQFEEIDPIHPIPFEDYVDAVGIETAATSFATEYSLIPNGRAATRLTELYERRPASHYFGDTCRRELSSPHHMHVDLYGNYIAGLCAGISLGDARQPDALFSGIDLDSSPFLKRVIREGVAGLFDWAVAEFGFKEDEDGYIAKCHVCLDIRRHLFKAGAGLKELNPSGFYKNL